MDGTPPDGVSRPPHRTADGLGNCGDDGEGLFDKGGAAALPTRLVRYGSARHRAETILAHLDTISKGPASRDHAARAADRLRTCGDFLHFRHYHTVDQVRLHRASLCRQHLVCPLCAIRRSVKLLGAYLPKFETIMAEQPHLRPVMLTYTVKNGPDLAERMGHLRNGIRTLTRERAQARRRAKGGNCTWRHLAGSVGALEATWSRKTGWHPHMHMIALADGWMDANEMRAEWKRITGDSHILRIDAVRAEDPAKAFCEVLKYAVKFSGMRPAQVWEAADLLRGQRLISSLGCFRGVEVPDQLADEPLDDLPFVDLFYRYLGHAAYGLDRGTPPGQGGAQ